MDNRTSTRWTIVADDLTGAADTAACFVSGGQEGVAVAMLPDRAAPAGARVVAMATATRHQHGAAVRAATAGAFVRARQELPDSRWFLKIDSTLRGDIAAMVAGAIDARDASDAANTGVGMLAATPGRPVVVCPAFPAQGRTIVGGRLRLQSDGTSAGNAGAAVTTLTPSLHATLAVVGGGARVEVRDAENEDDLRVIAQDVWRAGSLAVGSAGLARALAACCCAVEVPASPVPIPASPVPRMGVERVVVVAGTRHECTAAQLAWLREHPRRNTVVLTTPSDDDATALGSVINRLEAILADHRAPPTTTVGLVLTGGDTALGVLEAFGADGIRLMGEVEPGIPFGHVIGGQLAGTALVLKSGGFGRASTIADAVTRLLAGRP